MVNHGLSTGALFLLVGMIYDRRHTREMDAYGGLWKVMPVYAVFTLIVTLSSMGLPGLNGFVGEFTILLGAFGSQAIGSPWFAGFATLGIILAAVYLLFMFQKLFLGPVDKEENRVLLDLNLREVVTIVPLLVLIFWIGLYPRPFFALMAPSVERVVAALQMAAGWRCIRPSTPWTATAEVRCTQAMHEGTRKPLISERSCSDVSCPLERSNHHSTG
jgi:NADH-quinone oxidoreductase subunit M